MRFWCVAALLVLAASVSAAEPRKLTSGGRLKRDPLFVDGGRVLIYTVQETSPRSVLMRLTLEERGPSRIHAESSLPEMKPSSSSDGKRFAYLKITGNDMSQVAVDDVLTQQTIALKFTRPAPWDPVITPDGQSVVNSLDGQLVKKPIDGGEQIALTKSSGLNNWPAISSDGKQIAFGSSRRGDYDIYTMTVDGTDLTQITDERRLDARPAWSPDGQQIAFTSARDGNYEIYVMHSDGSRVRRVTNHPERDDFVTWHPDGKRVAYVSEREGKFDVYLVDVPQ